MKTIKPGLLCCFIAVTWNALLRFTHSSFFHENRMLLSFTSCHLLFANIHAYIFYTLYFNVFCFVIFTEFASDFSKELISLCGQKSDGFYPKLKAVFLYWQSVACKACYIGHDLNGLQIKIINTAAINNYLVEMGIKQSQKRHICKPDSKVAVVYMPAIYTDFLLCAISRYHRNRNNMQHRERQSSFIKKGNHWP